MWNTSEIMDWNLAQLYKGNQPAFEEVNEPEEETMLEDAWISKKVFGDVLATGW